LLQCASHSLSHTDSKSITINHSVSESDFYYSTSPCEYDSTACDGVGEGVIVSSLVTHSQSLTQSSVTRSVTGEWSVALVFHSPYDGDF